MGLPSTGAFRPSISTAPRDVDGMAVLGRTLHDLRGIRFDNGEEGNKPPAPTPPADGKGADGKTDEERGYPLDTKTDDMTDAQKAAYWHAQSKKQQKLAESRGDYDALKTKADELEALKAANATDQEKAVEAAKKLGADEARASILTTTVPGLIATLAGKSLEDLGDTLDVLDVTKFGTADGGIDLEKVAAFAKTLAPSDNGNNPPTDPVRAALGQQSGSAQPTGGSIAALEEQRFQELTKSNSSK